MFYPMFVEAGQEDLYLEFERTFLTFCAGLHAWTPIHQANLVKSADGSETHVLKSIDHWSELERLLRPALREESNLDLVFMEQRVVMLSGFDLTWHLWLFEPVSESFTARLQNSGLHILEHT